MISSFLASPVVQILILRASLEIMVSASPIYYTNYENNTDIPRIVSRQEWKAREARKHEEMKVSPTPYVVVHHGGIKKYCHGEKTCSAIVRSYQNLHMDDNGWFDIGYSFVIGEDGNAYEGRGWDYVGAHAPGYNSQSIGICVVGDFSDFVPNDAALKTLNDLINYGVSLGKISENYRILGHRQARNTLCPGEEFYNYLQKHPRWVAKPIPIHVFTAKIPTVIHANLIILLPKGDKHFAIYSAKLHEFRYLVDRTSFPHARESMKINLDYQPTSPYM